MTILTDFFDNVADTAETVLSNLRSKVMLPFSLAGSMLYLSSCDKGDPVNPGGGNISPAPITVNNPVREKVGMSFRINDAESYIQGAALQFGSNSNNVIYGLNTYLTADDAPITTDASKLGTDDVTRPNSKKVNIKINAPNIVPSSSSKPGFVYKISAKNPAEEIITYSRDTTDTPLASYLVTTQTTNPATGQITYTNTTKDVYQVKVLANDVTKAGVAYQIFKNEQAFRDDINTMAKDANRFAEYYGVSNFKPKSSSAFYSLTK